MPGLFENSNCFRPTKNFFNTLADSLADGVTGVASRAGIDCRSLLLASHMRRGSEPAQPSYEIGDIICFIRSNRDAVRSRNLLYHLYGSFSFGCTCGMG